MTGIGVAEAGIHHPAALGMVITIFIDQMDKLSGAGDIGATGNGHHRMRQQQSLGEEGRPIGATVVIRVFQDNDAIIGGAPWLVMGIGFAARYPETPTRVPIHIDRLVDHGIGGEEIDFKAVSNREGLQFLRHVRLRDFVRNIVAGVNNLLPGKDLINHTAIGCGLAQPRDQFFFFFGKTFQVIHLAGQVAHFMPAKQVGIGFVQRPQTSRIETVFLDDQLAQPFILRRRTAIDDGDTVRVFAIVPGEGCFAVDLQRITRGGVFDEDYAGARKGKRFRGQIEAESILGLHQLFHFGRLAGTQGPIRGKLYLVATVGGQAHLLEHHL